MGENLIHPLDRRELPARTRAHLRRSMEHRASSTAPNQIKLGRVILDLTEREFELLHMMARRSGKALASTWIFEQIWGYSPDLEIKPLTVYVRRLREKTEDDASRPEVLPTIRGFGYKLVKTVEPIGVTGQPSNLPT